MAGPLEDRVVLVTGARQGLGRAITVAFVEAGAKVLALDVSLDGMEATLRLCDETRRDRVRAVELDLIDATSAGKAVESCVEHFGELHCLVNNASVWLSSALENLTVEDGDRLQRRIRGFARRKLRRS